MRVPEILVRGTAATLLAGAMLEYKPPSLVEASTNHQNLTVPSLLHGDGSRNRLNIMLLSYTYWYHHSNASRGGSRYFFNSPN